VECHMNNKMDLLLLVFVYVAQVTPGLPKQTWAIYDGCFPLSQSTASKHQK